MDGPARKESTSCSGVCAVVGVGFMVDDDAADADAKGDDDLGSGTVLLL